MQFSISKDPWGVFRKNTVRRADNDDADNDNTDNDACKNGADTMALTMKLMTTTVLTIMTQMTMMLTTMLTTTPLTTETLIRPIGLVFTTFIRRMMAILQRNNYLVFIFWFLGDFIFYLIR